MTDKQIIIDDVYVYKCVNAKRSIFGIDVECRLGGDCSQNPNCYYKQFKRKEQECERLKHDNGYEVGALERTIDKLKSENKHLNDLLNQALKELEELQEGLANG